MMTKTTLTFAIVMILLGMGAYVGAGRSNSMLLVPMFFGLVLGVLGYLGIKREAKRKLFMQFSAVIAWIGVIWAVGEAVRSYGAARTAGIQLDQLALFSEITMAAVLFVYVNLSVRHLLAARPAAGH
jgi:hypothetical protein